MPLKILQEKKQSPIKHTIAIAAGKGGVGKSTLTVQLALSLKKMGYSVGILDGDLYGPSIRKMLPEENLPLKGMAKLIPAECLGIRLMTLAYFVDESSVAAWRYPVANSFATQFFSEVEWGPLDFLLIDFPPGTGDLPMTLAQKGNLIGALLITTPQEVAVQDVIKAHKLFELTKVPILGVVENMGSFELPDGSFSFPFGKDGGKHLATTLRVPFFGTIPLDPAISKQCDLGHTSLNPHPKFLQIAEELLEHIAKGFLLVRA